jgi:hypothetical protein
MIPQQESVETQHFVGHILPSWLPLGRVAMIQLRLDEALHDHQPVSSAVHWKAEDFIVMRDFS